MQTTSQPERAPLRARSAMPVVVRVVDVLGSSGGSIGFSAVKPMLALMLGDLFLTGQHTAFLGRFASEIAFLFPKLGKRPELARAPDLATIAIPPSRRRLHKESEQIFRVTQAIVHLVLEWTKTTCPSGLSLRFHDVARMDEQSLRVLLRLAVCAPPTITIRATRGTMLDGSDDTASVLQPFLRRRAQRDALLGKLEERIPREVFVPEHATSPVPEVEAEWGETIEFDKTRLFEEALATREPERVGPALVRALEAAIFTQNNDHALSLVERALPMFPLLPRRDRREVVLHLGILHAFMRHFDLALAAMDASYGLSHSPLERAESRFFAGLLLTKRLGRPKDGRAAIDEALLHVGALPTAEACVERAWLYNLRALSFVAEKDLTSARACCKKVLANLKGAEHAPDATHIKINVISNITVLDEYGKDLAGALARWGFFESFLVQAGPVFGKHYLFRKAGLLAKARRFAEATSALEACFALAESTRDAFYGDVIARGLAGLAWAQADFERAARWCERSLAAKKELLHDDDRERVTFAFALCLKHAGDLRAPVVAWGLPRELREALASDDVPSERIRWALPLPETKLNRPFEATSFY